MMQSKVDRLMNHLEQQANEREREEELRDSKRMRTEETAAIVDPGTNGENGMDINEEEQ